MFANLLEAIFPTAPCVASPPMNVDHDSPSMAEPFKNARDTRLLDMDVSTKNGTPLMRFVLTTPGALTSIRKSPDSNEWFRTETVGGLVNVIADNDVGPRRVASSKRINAPPWLYVYFELSCPVTMSKVLLSTIVFTKKTFSLKNELFGYMPVSKIESPTTSPCITDVTEYMLAEAPFSFSTIESILYCPKMSVWKAFLSFRLNTKLALFLTKSSPSTVAVEKREEAGDSIPIVVLSNFPPSLPPPLACCFVQIQLDMSKAMHVTTFVVDETSRCTPIA